MKRNAVIVSIKFWATEHPKGWRVWYSIGECPPVCLHGSNKFFSELQAKEAVYLGERWVVKAIITYRNMMGWHNLPESPESE